MRVWDVPVQDLCRTHLLGEHRELHAVWTVLSEGKKGYSRHPETIRWQGKLAALYARHEEQVKELARRGYHHRSPLDKKRATGSTIQDMYVNTLEEQHDILKNKPCDCYTIFAEEFTTPIA